MDRTSKPEPDDASTPDLASVDAGWDEGEADAAEATSSDGADDGWETIPDPKGGPPQRRRLSPKERAREKREKQRAKADAAAQKQKKKKARPGREGGESEPEEISDASEPGAELGPSERKPPPAGKKKKTFDTRTIAMIAAALALAIVALYFMLTSRR
jgi:hypothetical protein